MGEQIQVEKQKHAPKKPEEPIDDLPEITPNKVSENAAIFLLKMAGYEAA